tara:strand:+ start:598 stop:1104 length:507 start_codon:yes stop_codon:yes gene_type:complete
MRTPFKMKSSPTKGKLGDFFKGLGKEGTKKRQDAQRAKNEGGLTNFEKRQAAKKAARKGTVKTKPKAKVTVKPNEFAEEGVLETQIKKSNPRKVTTVNTEKTSKAKKSADNSVGVKKTDKVDHNKNLKGLKSGSYERMNYYNKHKLKHDKTSKLDIVKNSTYNIKKKK